MEAIADMESFDRLDLSENRYWRFSFRDKFAHLTVPLYLSQQQGLLCRQMQSHREKQQEVIVIEQFQTSSPCSAASGLCSQQD